ncbi:hypothetical protein [Rhodanobacter glycinis]|uniref:Uncharacterized protein n=1 Tax=Rhodanobacter glycinis TaxID=582702 RepID=A0A1I4EYP4_9GAMM|nr:hypothetical protein [Rhodanobacter glycinis]SFL09666.1 hypothetical protein SAMN05192579_11447 [Rhodanobacter glycinis]
MRPALQRLLMAYRPLYMNGLLRDGQFHLPKVPDSPVPAPARSSAPAPRRGLRVALANLLHLDSRHRSQS